MAFGPAAGMPADCPGWSASAPRCSRCRGPFAELQHTARLPIVQSMNFIEAIVAEYVEVLDAIDACRARPASTRSLARPGRPYSEGGAIRINIGGQAVKQRLEETRLLSRLMQLEAIYGGDRDDFRRLAASA
jgi:hypothetical protein